MTTEERKIDILLNKALEAISKFSDHDTDGYAVTLMCNEDLEYFLSGLVQASFMEGVSFEKCRGSALAKLTKEEKEALGLT